MSESMPNFWDPTVMATALSPQEKALRDLFVKEYLKDRDAVKAAVRCGFLKSIAPQYAGDLMACPYVLKQIDEAQRKLTADPEAYRAQLKAQLQQEASNPFSPAAARITALIQLTKIEGMDKSEDKSEDKELALINAMKEFAQKAPV